MPKHEFTRVRQETIRRKLRISAKQQVTPCMLRLLFQSEELQGFNSPSPDDHIKIFLQKAGGTGIVARDFTPRAWDARSNTLTLDFALHPQGPAVDWARASRVGDQLEIGGPRGSSIAPDDFDWHLLIGDATALPSIARRFEELPQSKKSFAITLVKDEQEHGYLAHAQDVVTWLHATEDAQQDLRQVLSALETLPLPTGDGLIWIAAEAAIARGVYRFVLDTLHHPREWVKAGAYWSAGKADGGERIG